MIKQTVLRVLIGGLVLNVLLAGIGFSFYFFFIRPMSDTFINTSREIAQLKERETSLQASKQEVEQRNNDLAKLDAAFLNLENAVPFITFIESVAAQSNVTVSIQTAKSPAETKKAEFQISAAGTLSDSMHFIRQMELLPYFTEITSVNITTKGTQVGATLQVTALTL